MGDSMIFKTQTPTLTSLTTQTAMPQLSLDSAGNCDNTKTNTKTKTNRCPCCKHKLHLTDVPCGKCGDRYCMSHRLPELHQCGYDFKEAGRVALTAANPQVRADKVADRI
jgi:hypothetical protein